MESTGIQPPNLSEVGHLLDPEDINYFLPGGEVIPPKPWEERTIAERQKLWRHNVSNWSLRDDFIDQNMIFIDFGKPWSFNKALNSEGEAFADRTFDKFDQHLGSFLKEYSRAGKVFVCPSFGASISLESLEEKDKLPLATFQLRPLLFLLGKPTEEIAKLERAISQYRDGDQDTVVWQLIANVLQKEVSIFDAAQIPGTLNYRFDNLEETVQPKSDWIAPPVKVMRNRLVTDENGITTVVRDEVQST